MNKSFCSYPFNHLSVDINGRYRLCCNAVSTNHSITEFSAKEWFNSDYIKEVRQKMIKGEFVKDCFNCYEIEKKGQLSKRLRKRLPELSQSPDVELDQLRIKCLDIRPGSLCNANCLNCNPNESTTWRKQLNDENYLRKSEYPTDSLSEPELDLKAILNGFEKSDFESLRSIYIAGGEPLLMKNTNVILNRISSNAHLMINTNLSVIPSHFLNELKNFKELTMIASCDGVGIGFDMMRYPIKFKQFDENINKLIDELPHMHLVLNFTLSALNLPEALNIFIYYEQIKRRHEKTMLDTHFLLSPKMLRVNNLEREVREKLVNDMKKNSLFDSLKKENKDRVLKVFDSVKQEEDLTEQKRKEFNQYVLWVMKKFPTFSGYLRGLINL